VEGLASKFGRRDGKGEGRSAGPKKGQGQEKEGTAQRCIRECSDSPACWPTLAFLPRGYVEAPSNVAALAVQLSAGSRGLAKHWASASLEDGLLTPPLEGTLGEGSQRFLKSEGDLVLPFLAVQQVSPLVSSRQGREQLQKSIFELEQSKSKSGPL
jgi:hypothetical protein